MVLSVIPLVLCGWTFTFCGAPVANRTSDWAGSLNKIVDNVCIELLDRTFKMRLIHHANLNEFMCADLHRCRSHCTPHYCPEVLVPCSVFSALRSRCSVARHPVILAHSLPDAAALGSQPTAIPSFQLITDVLRALHIYENPVRAVAIAIAIGYGVPLALQRSRTNDNGQRRANDTQLAVNDVKPLIAVIGAGGEIGQECVRRLLAQDLSVRCVVRDPRKYEDDVSLTAASLLDILGDFFGSLTQGDYYVKRTSTVFDRNERNPLRASLPKRIVRRKTPSYMRTFGSAEVVRGSVTDEASLRTALKGISGVIFAATASSASGFWNRDHPHFVDYQGVRKAADAAVTSRAKRFVLISSRLVNPINKNNSIRMMLNENASLMDYKFMGEEELRRSDITDYVIVRPGDKRSGGKEDNAIPSTQHLVYGPAEADLGSLSNIDPSDVAAVVCEAITCSNAACKTIEVVAKTAELGETTSEEQLAGIFDSIPQDLKAPSHDNFDLSTWEDPTPYVSGR